MANPLADKTIILGVTGSIAAYKSAELASKLTQAGARVHVILTPAAEKFISPLTFQSVTGNKAYTDADLWGGEGHVVHVSIGRSADLVVVAPISANTMAKLAYGLADNLLTVTVLAAACPLVIAPAMDAGMFSRVSTQTNVEILKARGVTFIGPTSGHLASGLEGLGRMTEPTEIASQIRFLLSRKGPLQGFKIVVTAGGTQEAIDPVRMISNRSSGKQGYALAQAALDAGAEVVLITAPSALNPPAGVQAMYVQSAEEMHKAVIEQIKDSAALIMAAAVADFKPSTQSTKKLKKESGIPVLEFEQTQDILKSVYEKKKSMNPELKVIGFAAETDDLITNAIKKVASKHLDMIVANDVTDPQAGFAVDTNRVTLIYSDGSTEPLPLLGKDQVAEKIIQTITSWLRAEG